MHRLSTLGFLFRVLRTSPTVLLLSAALTCGLSTPGLSQEEVAEVEMFELGLPSEIELNALIQIIGDELGLKIMSDDRIGNERIRILLPDEVPHDSLREILEEALRIKGLILVESRQDGWLEVLRGDDLIDRAPLINADQDIPEGAGPSTIFTQVIHIQNVDVEQAEAVIKPFVTDPGGTISRIGNQPMLMVTDYADNLTRIVQVIGLLDRPGPELTMRSRAIINLDAGEAESELHEIMIAHQRAAHRGQVPAPGIETVVQARLNTLVLIGPEDLIDFAENALSTIDAPLNLEPRIYRFSTAMPSRVDQFVQELLDDVTRERFYRSAVDDENGILIITTTPAIHEQVAAVQRDLDHEIEAGRPVVCYYKLANAKADEIITTIQGLEGIAPAPGRIPGRSPGNSPGNALDPVLGNTIGDLPGIRDDATSGGGASGGGGEFFDPSLGAPTRNGQNNAVPWDTTSLSPALQTNDANIVAHTQTNTIIVVAEESRQQYYADIIRRLDHRRPQVMIEVTLVAISTSVGKALGVEVARFGNEDDDPRVITFSSFGLSDSGGDDPALINASLGFNGAIISKDIANVIIKALKADGRTQVISAPKILVNDNATGTLSSTTDAPTANINASSTVSTTSFGGFESAGTTITVTPQISEGDHLSLAYAVELSTFGESSSSTLPPPRQRESLQSEVTVPDGHTIIVGGLNRNDLTESISRIPWLGEIPIIEYFFSSRSNNDSEATLFVFIKPVILRDDAFEGLKYLSTRDLELAGLPGDYPTSEPLLIDPRPRPRNSPQN